MPFLPVGGQAVIEGVMMRSPSGIAVAVRRPDGTLGYLEKPFVSITRRVKALGLPVIRGAVSLAMDIEHERASAAIADVRQPANGI